MADPLSLTASILAVISAGNAFCKGASRMYTIAKHAGSLAEDIDIFATSIITFGSTAAMRHVIGQLGRSERGGRNKDSDNASNGNVEYGSAIVQSSAPSSLNTHDSRLVNPSFNPDAMDYQDVYPSQNKLVYDIAASTRAINGYIGSRYTTALINESFPENIISQSYTIEIGADVSQKGEDYDREQDTLRHEGYATSDQIEQRLDHDHQQQQREIVFNAYHKEAVLGIAKISWSRPCDPTMQNEHNKWQQQQTLPLKLTCLVCDTPPYRLIFGQTFLHRRRYYWGQSED
ncbi:hypothetical protein MBLNU459_g7696t2 [Dothideomycetes sp. NU459]